MLFGRLSSSSLTLNDTSQTKACAVKLFPDELERPCGNLLPYFHDMELSSEENLDDLCRMDESMWEDVKSYLLGKGVTVFRWLIIKNGLRARASVLLNK